MSYDPFAWLDYIPRLTPCKRTWSRHPRFPSNQWRNASTCLDSSEKSAPSGPYFPRGRSRVPPYLLLPCQNVTFVAGDQSFRTTCPFALICHFNRNAKSDHADDYKVFLRVTPKRRLQRRAYERDPMGNPWDYIRGSWLHVPENEKILDENKAGRWQNHRPALVFSSDRQAARHGAAARLA